MQELGQRDFLQLAATGSAATIMPTTQWFVSPIRMDANSKPQPYLTERWDLSPDQRSLTRGLPPRVRQRPSPVPLPTIS
ncbi:MAG: hypothetical protein KAY21_09640 [Limnohabitans sp.]|nr:hypothetical protein [Limnohabitans sp.]